MSALLGAVLDFIRKHMGAPSDAASSSGALIPKLKEIKDRTAFITHIGVSVNDNGAVTYTNADWTEVAGTTAGAGPGIVTELVCGGGSTKIRIDLDGVSYYTYAGAKAALACMPTSTVETTTEGPGLVRYTGDSISYTCIPFKESFKVYFKHNTSTTAQNAIVSFSYTRLPYMV